MNPDIDNMRRDIFGFTDKEIAQGLKENTLLSLEVEFSARCNLRCIYCYTGKSHFRNEELEIEEIFDIISQAKALGAKKIIYVGAGEPLLDPKLCKVIRYTNKLKLEHILFTNATLIDAKFADFFYENNVSVVVKYNSHNPKVYDKLSGVPGAFEYLQKGLDCLYKSGYPDKTHSLSIETIICRQNINEIPDLWQWARDKNILPYFECITMAGSAESRKDILVEKEKIKDVFKQLAEIDRLKYNLNWTPHPPIAGFSCKRHLYSCTINSQGIVHPCVGLNIPLGQIRDSKLKNILKRSKVRRDLIDIKNTIKGQCKDCDLSHDCYGCRASAYSLTGDYLASDPTCWRIT